MKTCKMFFRFSVVALLCLPAFMAIGQTPRVYKKHDIVELTGGLKFEVLQCRGEGPLEECDVIYYTDKRQSGRRMWQNANRLRDEERSAFLEKEIAKQKADPANNKGAIIDVPDDLKNSQEQAIATSIETKKREEAIKNNAITLAKTEKTADTLSIANLKKQVKALDSIVKAKTKKEIGNTVVDSAEYNKLIIPKVNSKGETKLINTIRTDSSVNNSEGEQQDKTSADTSVSRKTRLPGAKRTEVEPLETTRPSVAVRLEGGFSDGRQRFRREFEAFS